jgi:hypothetical protein
MNSKVASNGNVKGIKYLLVNAFIYKWYYFVLSIILTFSVAEVYLSVTPSYCMRNLSLLVKESSKDETSYGTLIKYFFNDMALFNSKADIRNEISTVKSLVLMEAVVKRLGLNENYTVSNVFKNDVLYKTSPINIQIGKADSSYNSLSFQIKMLSNNKYIISHMILNGKKKNCRDIKGYVAVAMQTPLGVLTVLPTHAFTKRYIGIPVNYSKEDIKSAANRYLAALNVSLSDKKAKVADLFIEDVSIARAKDILNTLAAVYNENQIKNKITVNNAQLINPLMESVTFIAPCKPLVLLASLAIGLYFAVLLFLYSIVRRHKLEVRRTHIEYSEV